VILSSERQLKRSAKMHNSERLNRYIIDKDQNAFIDNLNYDYAFMKEKDNTSKGNDQKKNELNYDYKVSKSALKNDNRSSTHNTRPKRRCLSYDHCSRSRVYNRNNFEVYNSNNVEGLVSIYN